jgi:hypothetical protein
MGAAAKERAGFHTWSESSSGIIGDPAKLSGAYHASPSIRSASSAAFFPCQTDAPRALRGLAAQAAASQWPTWAWHPFLWAAPKLQDVDDVKRIAQLLLEWPKDSFSEIAADASWWLKEAAKVLDENLLWALWDRITEASLQQIEKAHDE